MAILKLALPTIFLHEGRYVNHPNDPGGATNFGISLRFLKSTGDLDKDGWPDGDINHDGRIDTDDIKQMSEVNAVNLYGMYFWARFDYGRIDDQDIATKIFDLCINMGNVGAHKCMQRALRSASGIILVEDGILGSQSFKAINTANPLKLYPALKSEAAGYYRSIKYKGSEDFLRGWLNRAYSDAV